MRYVVILAALAAAGCTTYKLWTYYGSEPENGTVQLSYEYHKFENPQVDERAGTNMARERCRDFGLPDAVRKGEDRVCVDGDKASCPKWRVIREYRCVKAGQR
jgi:hypothetical protein